MKIYKEIQTTQTLIEKIICNKCGETCTPEKYNHTGIEALISGCYESKYFQDGTDYYFDLCEKCSWDLIQSFKTPPSES